MNEQKVLGKCQLRGAVEEKDEGLDSLGEKYMMKGFYSLD